MKDTTLQFATLETAHARVNQLQATLKLPLTPAAETIDEEWENIEALEEQLAAKSAAPAAGTSLNPAVVPPTAPQPKPSAVGSKYVGGLARAIAANTGEKPATPNTPGTELTGIARAAAANAKLQSARKS
jgi:hypothetical protein